jgi:hypothetical protein
MAQPDHLPACQPEFPVAIIDEHEIVPRTVHLRKGNFHSQKKLTEALLRWQAAQQFSSDSV